MTDSPGHCELFMAPKRPLAEACEASSCVKIDLSGSPESGEYIAVPLSSNSEHDLLSHRLARGTGTINGPILGKLEISSEAFLSSANLVHHISNEFLPLNATIARYQRLLGKCLDSASFDVEFKEIFGEVKVVPFVILDSILQHISSDKDFFPHGAFSLLLSQHLVADSAYPNLFSRILEKNDLQLISDYLDYCLGLSEMSLLNLTKFLFKLSGQDGHSSRQGPYDKLLERLFVSPVDFVRLNSMIALLDLKTVRWLLSRIKFFDDPAHPFEPVSSNVGNQSVWLEALLGFFFKTFEMLEESDVSPLRTLHAIFNQEIQNMNVLSCLTGLLSDCSRQVEPLLRQDDFSGSYQLDFVDY